MPKKDYYSVLGVRRDASEREIKQTYRRLARQYHPDVNPGDAAAEQKFKEISEAYAVLGNAESRKKYDRFGHQAFTNGFDPSFAGGGGFGSGPGAFKDFFGGRASFEGFGSIFEDLLGGSRQRTQQAPVAGQDLEHVVEISFEEAMRGTTTQVQITRREGGSERLQVKIPPGVDTGSKVRVAGKGDPGKHHGVAGDLYIVMRVRPHAYFAREGNDILCTVPVTLSEVLLGAKIEVPTIDGKTAVTLPAGTQNGRRLRLRGKGAPALHGGGRGDQYVTVQVVLPETLDMRSRELLEEFALRNPLQPRAHMGW
ncbi:MAG: J domain-containing protein [Candidatus Tectomicrobia bacterium]|uniref:J domain-containing protein n=1 Tax=Tectimicrobiota bacterium TaxID=2528274 RepID=A0A937VXU6_UNCTE|nr:J domain-containing protein [Candidatus Tectomicrobia bacterium]